MKSIALLIVLCVSAIGQSNSTGAAETKGACSPANTGDKNTFNIKCGIGKEQGDKIIKLLNEILIEHLDPGAVMTKLKNIESQVNTTGVLEPASQTDAADSKLDPSVLTVYLGSFFVAVHGDKCTLLKISEKDVLWIERAPSGILIQCTSI